MPGPGHRLQHLLPNSDLLPVLHVGRTSTIRQDPAKSVLDKMGGKGNVVIVEGLSASRRRSRGLEGNKKALEEYPDVKVIEQKTANWSRAEAYDGCRKLADLPSGQDQGRHRRKRRDGDWSLEAIKGHGLDPKKIPIAGVDGVTDTAGSGEMMSTLQDADAQAQGAIGRQF